MLPGLGDLEGGKGGKEREEKEILELGKISNGIFPLNPTLSQR